MYVRGSDKNIEYKRDLNGFFRGIIMDDADPSKFYRCKIFIPELHSGYFTNEKGEKIAKNTVVIRPGKLDRSPCGTGTSARLALLRKKNQIDIKEKIISKSIIDSTFECFIENEIEEDSKKMILPNIKGSAFITGEQVLYLDDKDPFPQGYRLNDTWPL